MDKLCPFRKRTYFMKTYGEQEFNISSNKAEFTKEEFLPCIKGKCLAYYEQNIGYSTPVWKPCCKLMI